MSTKSKRRAARRAPLRAAWAEAIPRRVRPKFYRAADVSIRLTDGNTTHFFTLKEFSIAEEQPDGAPLMHARPIDEDARAPQPVAVRGPIAFEASFDLVPAKDLPN